MQVASADNEKREDSMMIRTTLLPLTTAVLIAGPGGAQTAGEQTLAETGPKVASFSTLL